MAEKQTFKGEELSKVYEEFPVLREILGHFDPSKSVVDENVKFDPDSALKMFDDNSNFDVNSDVNCNVTDEDIIQFVQDNSINLSGAVDTPLITSKPVNTLINTDVERIVYCTWTPRSSITFEQPSKPKNSETSNQNCETLTNFNLNLKWFLHSKVYQMKVQNKTIEIGTLDTKPHLMKGNLSQVVKYILVQALGDLKNYSLRGKKNIPREILSAIEKLFSDTQLLAFYDKCRFSMKNIINKQVVKALKIAKNKT